MKSFALTLVFILGAGAYAQSAITLDAYLEQVKSKNPQARALVEDSAQYATRMDEGEALTLSEIYGTYKTFNDRNEPTNPNMPSHTESNTWRFGWRDRTEFGLSADVYFDSNHTQIDGGNLFFAPLRDYQDSRFGIDLRQSLWRNGFGYGTRADLEAARAQSRLNYLKARLDLKNLLTRAENTYWSLVAFSEVVKLQEENVARARKLSDWMRGREGLRLVDDVDALQAQAALETRELELQQSLDELNSFRRQFNTLRGLNSDEVGPLAPVPTDEMLRRTTTGQSGNLSREDFKMIFEQGRASAAVALSNHSKLQPELDIIASLSGNGLDEESSKAYEEASGLRHPTTMVGISFSTPLDFSFISRLWKASKAQQRAAAQLQDYSEFAARRAWDDLVKQKAESQVRYEKAVKLEELQTRLVKRERARLLNGRSTTFQTTTFEQNLALAQIQRVRSQLALVQLHNLLKQFEANL